MVLHYPDYEGPGGTPPLWETAHPGLTVSFADPAVQAGLAVVERPVLGGGHSPQRKAAWAGTPRRTG